MMPDSTPPAAVSFWEAFRFWLKLGFISFGGPAGQISVMHQELVDKRRWLSEGRFLHALNYCMVLPGPEAQQLATYIGWLMHRTWGGVVAGVLFVLPSFMFILLGGPLVESTHGQLKFTAPLTAITAAVVGVILNLALFFAYHVLWPQGFAGHFDVVSAAIALVAALVLFRFKQSVMRVIAASALLGLLLQVSGVQGS
ncbi:MAG: chromate transporter [Azonexus sp.]|nr:chromate transporter [Azonexus sp.]